MKSVKTDTKQAPGACKDANAAVSNEAAVDKKRTTKEQHESKGERALVTPVTHDEIPRSAPARNTTKPIERCEYLELVKHMLSEFPAHLLAPTLKQLKTYDEPCVNSIKARRTPVNNGMSFGLCEEHVTVLNRRKIGTKSYPK